MITPTQANQIANKKYVDDLNAQTRVSLPVPIGSGGTGNTTSAGARQALEITPQNIGALSLAGGLLSGFLTLHSDPVNGKQAATKDYVDGVALSASIGTPIGITNGGTDGTTLSEAQDNLGITDIIGRLQEIEFENAGVAGHDEFRFGNVYFGSAWFVSIP